MPPRPRSWAESGSVVETVGAMVGLSESQRKANVRLALILASVALVFALGFMAKMAWF